MEKILLCPICRHKIVKMKRCYKCSNTECDFFVPQKISGKKLSYNQIEDLIIHGKTKVIRGFISKNTNRPFDAILELNGGRIEFNFNVNNYSRHKCPICGKPLSLETSAAVCRQSAECNYILSRFSGKNLTVNQIVKLLDGYTVEVYGFTSRSGRKFDARIKLVLDKNDKRYGMITIVEYI